MFSSPKRLDALALFSGATLPFAFAPYNQAYLAILAPALLLFSWLSASPARAAWRGLLFGLSFFGIGVYWVFISIHTFGQTPASIAAVITAGFVIVLALCIAVHAAIFKFLFRHPNLLELSLGFATSWALIEWIRSTLFTGFPWLLLGYSQINTPLAGFAPIIGVYGVSFIVALAASLLVNSLRISRTVLSLFGFVLIFLLGFGLKQIHWTRPIGIPLSVSLIQGNIPQSVKWDPASVPGTLAVYKELTLKNLHHQIIVWPEAAIPIFLSQASFFTEPLEHSLQSTGATLLTGVPLVDSHGKFYNAAVVLNGHGQYLKRHLVPFGEYVPFADLLRGLIGFFDLPLSNLSAGPAKQDLITLDGLPTAVAICYEVAYEGQFLKDFPQAKLIATLSDDAWFGDSWASWQQVQISQERSLETGRYQLVATNNGLTAIIDYRGNLVATAPRFIRTVLNGAVYDTEGSTPISKLGMLPVILILVLIFLALIVKKYRKGNS